MPNRAYIMQLKHAHLSTILLSMHTQHLQSITHVRPHHTFCGYPPPIRQYSLTNTRNPLDLSWHRVQADPELVERQEVPSQSTPAQNP